MTPATASASKVLPSSSNSSTLSGAASATSGNPCKLPACPAERPCAALAWACTSSGSSVAPNFGYAAPPSAPERAQRPTLSRPGSTAGLGFLGWHGSPPSFSMPGMAFGFAVWKRRGPSLSRWGDGTARRGVRRMAGDRSDRGAPADPFPLFPRFQVDLRHQPPDGIQIDALGQGRVFHRRIKVRE